MAKFLPGQSGNPGGKPKEIVEVVRLARQHTTMAIQALAAIASSDVSPPPARVAASVALLDRAWGKPLQAVQAQDVNGDTLPIINITFVKPE